MTTISALYVVGSDPEFLRESLQSVAPFVDQLVIIANQWQEGSAVSQILSEFPSAEIQRHAGSFKDVGERAFRNMGIAASTSEWIMRVDSDDILSNGWREEMDRYLHPEFGACTVGFYEHMGSYEYVHKNCEQTRILTFLKRGPGLRAGPGIDDLGYHSSFLYDGPCGHCDKVSYMHYGYARTDMVARLSTNILRGDHGSDKAAQAQTVARIESDGAWAHLPFVTPIPYPVEMIPYCMREKFGKTYKLELSPEGKILSRSNIPKSNG